MKSNLVFFINKFADTPLTQLHHYSDYFGNNWDDDASPPDGIDGDCDLLLIDTRTWLYECSCSNFNTGLACLHYWKVLSTPVDKQCIFFNPLVYHFCHWKDVNENHIPCTLHTCFNTLTVFELEADVFKAIVQAMLDNSGSLPVANVEAASSSQVLDKNVETAAQDWFVEEIEHATYVKNLLKKVLVKSLEEKSSLAVTDEMD
jgi:hypothetical protein